MTRRHLFRALFRAMASRPPAPGVSLRMAELIAAYRHSSDRIDALERSRGTDHPEWDAAVDAYCEALRALVREHPASMLDFAAKFDALIPAIEEDSERYILRTLADDARALAGEDGQ